MTGCLLPVNLSDINYYTDTENLCQYFLRINCNNFKILLPISDPNRGLAIEQPKFCGNSNSDRVVIGRQFCHQRSNDIGCGCVLRVSRRESVVAINGNDYDDNGDVIFC